MKYSKNPPHLFSIITIVGILLIFVSCGGGGGGGGDNNNLSDSDFIIRTLSSGKTMWIGAHPDDETLIAPLMAEVCLEKEAECVFLVVTKGEAGNCLLVQGCNPDVGTVRAMEMINAANLFNARLIQWDLGDFSESSYEEVLSKWGVQVGGEQNLIDRMINEISNVNPDFIITFDRLHGSTGHTAHQAIGSLVTSAFVLLTDVDLYHVESMIDVDPGSGDYLGFIPAVSIANIISYDANRYLSKYNKTSWDFLLLNIEAHPSQIPPERIQQFSVAPLENRRVYLYNLKLFSQKL